LAQNIGDPELLLEAHLLGNSLYFRGEFVSALEHIKQCIAIYNPQQHHHHAFIYGQDPGIVSLSSLVEVLWFLGYPDQSQEKLSDLIKLAKELSHPFSSAFALIFACCHNHLCRDWQATQESAEEAIALSTEYGFPMFLAQAILFRGMALARQGQANEEAIMQMRQSLDNLLFIGANACRTVFLELLAEAYEETKQIEEGLNVLTEALDFMEKKGENIFKSELYRLRGELLLMKDEEAEAEICFQKAIEASRQQQAKSLELRATMNLSHLYQKQGKREEALKMLQEIYDWFTEGFGTKDLQEAKALLEELS